MGFVSDTAEDLAANKAYEEGGYPAWIKFKAYMMWKQVTSCC